MRTTLIFLFALTCIIGCQSEQNQSNRDIPKKVDSLTQKKVAKRTNSKVNEKGDYKSDAQCDSDLVFYQYIHKNVSIISSKIIERFVDTLDSYYYNQNNASFGEYNSSMIFFVLENRTQDLLDCFSKLDTNKFNNWILLQLSGSVFPEDFDKIILKVEKVNCDKVLKQKIIKALTEGKRNIQKYNVESH